MEIEWYTPSSVIEAVTKAMRGPIDLDPASCAKANEVVKAHTYFDKEINGLQQDWKAKRLWMNPPFDKKLKPAFLTKFLSEFEKGHIGEATILVNNSTSQTKSTQALLKESDAVFFPQGRIAFVDKDGNKQQSNPAGQMLVYFGNAQSYFINKMEEEIPGVGLLKI